MTAVAHTPRRPRRVAADEAHAWARNLRLGNPLAKLVLSMLTIYVNGEGSCFVAIGTLAEDCELAENTVRRRLEFLEEVGAIARFAQWRDEHGRLNREGRGRRTTDDIRLLTSADPDQVEAKARGNGGSDDGQSSADDDLRGSPGEPQIEPENPVSPSLGVHYPSHCGESLTSEPEPEVRTPNPLSGGVQVVDQEFEDDLAAFAAGYPSPITNLPRLRTVLSALSPPERKRVLTAVKGYAVFIADCERKKKPRAVKDADRWVASGMWEGYAAAGERVEVQAQASEVAEDSDVGKALVALRRIAGMPPPLSTGGKFYVVRPLSAQALALVHAPPFEQWRFIAAAEVHRVRAWNDLCARELAGSGGRPEIVHCRNPGGARGFKAPWDWPPRKDGSIPEEGHGRDDVGTE